MLSRTPSWGEFLTCKTHNVIITCLMTYKVEIEETLARVIEVEAASEAEAIEQVDKEYRNVEIVLDSDDYVGYTVRAV